MNRALALIFIILATTLTSASSVASPQLRHERDKEMWWKLEFEQWLSRRLNEAASQISPGATIYVTAELVMVKTQDRAKYHRRQRITLEKFGIKIPSMETVSVAPGWFENIERVDIELRIPDSVSEERRAAIAEMPVRVVNFVNPAQVKVTLKTFKSPEVSWSNRLGDFFWALVVGCIFVLISAILFYRLAVRVLHAIGPQHDWAGPRGLPAHDNSMMALGHGPQLPAHLPALRERPHVPSNRRLGGLGARLDLKLADVFTAAQILEPGADDHPLDPEFMEMVLSCTPDIGLALFARNQKTGTILLNLLPSNVLADAVARMGPQELTLFTDLSGRLASENWADHAADVRDHLRAVLNESGYSHLLLERSLQMLPQLDAAKEAVVYENFVRLGRPDLVAKAAESCFPIQLIPRLPSFVLRLALRSISSDDQIEFLAGLSAEERLFYLDALGDSNDPLRSFVELELWRRDAERTQVLLSPERFSQLEHGFATAVRQVIASNPQAAIVARGLLNEWRTRVASAQVIRKGDSDAA